MKTMLAGLLLVLAIHFYNGTAGAIEAPVTLTHVVTSYTKEGDRLTIDYVLEISNPGDKAISNLSLWLVPSTLFSGAQVTFKLNFLGSRQYTNLFLQLKTAASFPLEFIVREPLMLGGSMVEADGKVVEFPVTSHPAGAH